MFCQQCGTKIEEGMAFCTSCGAKQVPAAEEAVKTEAATQPEVAAQPVAAAQPEVVAQPVVNQPYVQPVAAPTGTGSPKHVGFGEAIKLFFTNYANFKGRSTVSEYWFAYLFNFIVSLATSWIPVVGTIISLGLLVPGIAVGVRRLHDTGKSWLYMFMGLIPLAGFIILIIQYCKASDGDNKWGPAAKN